MKPAVSFWTKQAAFQLVVASCVLSIGDGVLRDQASFVVWYVQETSPSWPLSLWLAFMSSAPYGTLAAASLCVGGVVSVLTRNRPCLAEAWVLQLVATAAALASLWASISSYLTPIWRIGRSTASPHML